VDACHILYKYTYCIVISAKCWWNRSQVEVEGIHYIWIFLFLLLETPNARREMRILLVVFFHCWQRYAVCFFTVSFHKSHFAKENEMPMEITIFKSNTVRWEVVFEISRETVTIEWKRTHWFKLNVVDHYVNYTKLLLLSKLQSSKTSTPMNTVTFVSNKLLSAMCENNIVEYLKEHIIMQHDV